MSSFFNRAIVPFAFALGLGACGSAAEPIGNGPTSPALPDAAMTVPDLGMPDMTPAPMVFNLEFECLIGRTCDFKLFGRSPDKINPEGTFWLNTSSFGSSWKITLPYTAVCDTPITSSTPLVFDGRPSTGSDPMVTYLTGLMLAIGNSKGYFYGDGRDGRPPCSDVVRVKVNGVVIPMRSIAGVNQQTGKPFTNCLIPEDALHGSLSAPLCPVL